MSPSKMCPSKMSPSKICPSKMCPPIKCPSIKCPGADILAPDCFPIHPRLLEWSGLVTFCCSCQTAWWIPACCWLGWGSIGDPSKSHYVSVARLSYFWKVLETFSLTKLTQILGNFLYYFTNLSLCVKTSSAPFWATLYEIGLLLILASGHTDCKAGPKIGKETFFSAEKETLRSDGKLYNFLNICCCCCVDDDDAVKK